MSEIDRYYGKGRYALLSARIIQVGRDLYVELYNNEILVDLVEAQGKSVHWAESIAENFCNGIPTYEFWDKKHAADRENDPGQSGPEGGLRQEDDAVPGR